MKWDEPFEPGKRRGGFEDDPEFSICSSPSHAPPMHLYIPPGKRYRHVCPSCGKESVIRAMPVVMCGVQGVSP